MPVRFPLAAIVPAVSLLLFVARPAFSQGSAPDAPVKTPAMESCGTCHEERVQSMATNPHSILEREDYVLPHGATISCSVCHGDGTAHMDAGGGEGTIFNFTGEPAVRMEKCLSCHGSNPRFAASPHAQLGLACNSCHRIHSEHQSPPMLHPASGAASLTALDESSAMCAGCHGDVFTQFSYNERHRLAEGILQCSSCHDPHAPSQRTNLGGFKQEMCVSCHTDKGGPYVYEHGSVRVEGCVSCHEPHGTVARHQLRHQNVAELCYSCHAEVPSFHFSNTDPPRFDLTTQCTNCHSSIHGSNLDPFFLN